VLTAELLALIAVTTLSPAELLTLEAVAAFVAFVAFVAVAAVTAVAAFVALATVPVTLLPETVLICESVTQPTQAEDKESAVAAERARTA
jgi:hypothetical protein